MTQSNRSKATRRYNLRFFTAMAVYVAALFSSVWLIKHQQPSHLITILLAVLPSLPIVAIIVIVGLYLKEETDEFQREFFIQSLLWGMAGTLSVTSIWGFLEMNADSPHFPAFYTFVLFWACTGIAGCLLRLRFRGASDE